MNLLWKDICFVCQNAAVLTAGADCGQNKSNSEPFNIFLVEDSILTDINRKNNHTENTDNYCNSIVMIHYYYYTPILLKLPIKFTKMAVI